MNYLTVYKTVRFEASHVLPKHPGKCSRLHGHSWVCTVGVYGPVDEETGFVVDYAVLGALLQKEIVERCDHTHLGQWTVAQYAEQQYQCPFGPNFYPSSENLVVVFARILSPLIHELLPAADAFGLIEVSLDETCTSKATWRREEA